MAEETQDLKGKMHDCLRRAREQNLARLGGLSEHDLRRPMTPTGTNLLGVIKHLVGMEYGYLGETFGRHPAERPSWFRDDPNTEIDMWATTDESSDYIIGCYHQACAHADETIRALSLGAPGDVPHWDDGATTLGDMIALVHGEESRHGGHIDIVRELIDGRAGDNHDRLGDANWWSEYVANIQAAADTFADKS